MGTLVVILVGKRERAVQVGQVGGLQRVGRTVGGVSWIGAA
jgi:hypothetical protein